MEVDSTQQQEPNTPRSSEKFTIPLPAIFLIMLGSILLLKKLHWVKITYAEILWSFMMLFGVLRIIKGYIRRSRGSVIGGSFLFLYGLFFFLSTVDSFDFNIYMMPTAAFLIAGIALFMGFLCNVRDWFIVIPAVVLSSIGGALLLSEFGYLSSWAIWDAVHLYWPVIFILVGIALILKRKFSDHSTTQPTTP